jgi:hypothetical protein
MNTQIQASAERSEAQTQRPVGLPAPDPDNDISISVAPGEPQTPIETRHPRWPLLVIVTGAFLTLVWAGFLGWLVFLICEAIL